MLSEGAISFAASRVTLPHTPINRAWILGGKPVVGTEVLDRHADGTANTYVWDCTAGRFNWFYDADESVYLIEGSAVVRDERGIFNHLEVGSTLFFPAGSRAEWRVESYVRKIAFCSVPPTPYLMAAKQIISRTCKHLLGNRRSRASART
jgi:uncharacterized protein